MPTTEMIPGIGGRVLVVVGPDEVLVVGAGTGNSDAGTLASALDAKTCQIRAGHWPPWPSRRVRGGIMGVLSGNPTHTAATSSGVYPTNQAFL